MSAKATWIFIVLACTGILVWSVYRDLQLQKYYPGDLRNRVVGARLIKEGRSPYFYKWHQGDGVRYYDPSAFDSLKVSNITATPFFHHLLYPLAEMPQQQILHWWLLLEYLMLLVPIAVALVLATTQVQKGFILVTGAAFLLTEAWQVHITYGQNYVCIALLAMLFYYFMYRKNKLPAAFCAGILAITLVLIKPTAVFFFLPFLFVLKQYSRHYIIAFLVPIIVILTWTFASKQERFLWQDYKAHIAEQVKVHQGQQPTLQHNDPEPLYPVWEGVDKKAIAQQYAKKNLVQYSENGNVFIIVEKVFHKKIPVATLAIASVAVILLLTGMFYYRNVRNGQYNLASIAILGYCLFMVSDLCSPVFRHQYYTVQWLFPVLVAATVYTSQQKRLFFLLACGLFLNIINTAYLKMEHTIGEYLLLLALLGICFNRKTMAAQ